ncbi:MAG: ATP-grasp domain-containing protein, partial [Runella slithyformis]
ILIKASAGGGGKGMRIVENEAEFDEQMERAVSEAISSFGDGAVFVEKYVASPRHIEIQLLADQQGNTIYLFERECSVQRRHQKVVEEAPSSCLTPQIRAAMGECAVNVARSCGYYGAGTVEFIVDDKLDFYFLEMNTRLQVEHPVSEMITGVDLVRQMIYVAEGRTLEIKQEDLQINGHAVEVRVYAEDPANNFLPDVGTLQTYVRPQGNGVRVDDGFEQGMAIPIYYDPMIAKLITHAATRQEAIDKMVRAIDEYQITGVQTTLGFCRFVLQHEAFTSGQFDTHFVKHYFTPAVLKGQTNETEEKIVAALVGHLLQETKKTSNASSTITAQKSKWKANRS